MAGALAILTVVGIVFSDPISAKIDEWRFGKPGEGKEAVHVYSNDARRLVKRYRDVVSLDTCEEKPGGSQLLFVVRCEPAEASPLREPGCADSRSANGDDARVVQQIAITGIPHDLAVGIQTGESNYEFTGVPRKGVLPSGETAWLLSDYARNTYGTSTEYSILRNGRTSHILAFPAYTCDEANLREYISASEFIVR
ncbi:hypothetical protein nbrc107696_35280 [Gordonia spumicola]|uniref:Uncharacterized protein n=1 Tax=Gordonia spumicola TaxID=589161 RepID=A0A7I9VD04_9ACTN|nr:hypothetical protein [Gordonia spumicola]GEE03082.1 hypothetical protein nbrc107696_35280 [Gordonia spumicola]